MRQKIMVKTCQVTIEKQQGWICHTARFCHLAEDALALSSVGASEGSLRARSCSSTCMAPLLEMQDACPHSQTPQPLSNSQSRFLAVMGSQAISKFLATMFLCYLWGIFYLFIYLFVACKNWETSSCLMSGGFWGWV